MDNIYVVILILLLILSGFDLMVGVSNDAANFLNSAVGSRAASRRTIITVAAVGVLLGSCFSSGMMEIARSGVFMPGQFYFHDVMMIFLAVMLTDIILLDLFNTYGLPTSTTVSIVFSLLGAAVAVGVYKIATAQPGVAMNLSAYINSSKALAIIAGILSSVVVAFTCGVVIMWISRFLFSFHYKKSFRIIGSVWCGMALTAIIYFAIFKGLKGSAIVSKELLKNLDAHIWLYVVYAFVGCTLLMALLQYLFKINILKIAVLAGTMALALSFAGNDLVNFIGVFLAGQSSFDIAQGIVNAGGDISTLSMGDLAKPVVADWRYLMGAGVIMVLALVFSKKARTVTDTEVNLARQSGGIEQFGSVPPARFVVRQAVRVSKVVHRITPPCVAAFIDKRFQPLPPQEDNGASFDLIRASVNLTVSALLISLATSLKLPLSTTYVTFMVAMGSSLSDKAWGRDTAVYRITGVMTVIVGWFFTAFAAFASSCILALALVYGGMTALVIILLAACALLIKSAVIHRNRSHKKEEKISGDIRDRKTVIAKSAEINDLMERMTDIYELTLESLNNENRKKLKKLSKETRGINKSLRDRLSMEVIPTVNNLPPSYADRGKLYVQIMEVAASVFESLSIITRSSFDYIDNNHNGLDDKFITELRHMCKRITDIYPALEEMISDNDFTRLNLALEKADGLGDDFSDAIKNQVVLHSDTTKDMRSVILYLSLLNETRSMIRRTYLLAKSQRDFILSA